MCCSCLFSFRWTFIKFCINKNCWFVEREGNWISGCMTAASLDRNYFHISYFPPLLCINFNPRVGDTTKLSISVKSEMKIFQMNLVQCGDLVDKVDIFVVVGVICLSNICRASLWSWRRSNFHKERHKRHWFKVCMKYIGFICNFLSTSTH